LTANEEHSMSRIYAGILGSLAMAIVICRGLKDSAGVEGTLTMAVVAMVMFAVVGSVLGHIAQTTVDESVRRKIEQELAQQAGNAA
jgi:hypothetical protein